MRAQKYKKLVMHKMPFFGQSDVVDFSTFIITERLWEASYMNTALHQNCEYNFPTNNQFRQMSLINQGEMMNHMSVISFKSKSSFVA